MVTKLIQRKNSFVQVRSEVNRGHDAFVVGLVRIELTTLSLSVTRSNRLSYSP